jgi:hypothetical protein
MCIVIIDALVCVLENKRTKKKKKNRKTSARCPVSAPETPPPPGRLW